MKYILKHKRTGLYFDGVCFETGIYSNAKLIGDVSPEAVRFIWGDEVVMIEVPEEPVRMKFTFEHESGGMMFTVNSATLRGARDKLESILREESDAYTYWSLKHKEPLSEGLVRQVCSNGGNPA